MFLTGIFLLCRASICLSSFCSAVDTRNTSIFYYPSKQPPFSHKYLWYTVRNGRETGKLFMLTEYPQEICPWAFFIASILFRGCQDCVSRGFPIHSPVFCYNSLMGIFSWLRLFRFFVSSPFQLFWVPLCRCSTFFRLLFFRCLQNPIPFLTHPQNAEFQTQEFLHS